MAMTRKQKRLSVIGGAMAFLGLASGLTLYALGQKTSYFYMPADLQMARRSPDSASGLADWSKKAPSCAERAPRFPLP